MKTFRDIINLWPKPAPVNFAEDIGEEPGTTRQWRNRNRLPSSRWLRTVDAARKRRINGVTLEALARIAEAQGPT